MESKGILLIVLACVVMYFLLKSRNNIESFTQAEIATLNQQINAIYQADVESIRNLANISSALMSGGLTIPGNVNITGSLNVVPRGTITMWAGNIGVSGSPSYDRTQVPSGWALCDGSAYTFNGLTTRTPDLRGRYIRMFSDNMTFPSSGTFVPDVNLYATPMNVPTNNQQYLGRKRDDSRTLIFNNLSMGQYGGTDHHHLIEEEIPSHTHGVNDPGHSHNSWSQGNDDRVNVAGSKKGFRYNGNDNTSSSGTGITIQNTGGSGGHNTNSPFFVLAYIMKL